MNGATSFGKLGIEKDLGVSDITHNDLQDEVKCPYFLKNIEKYQKMNDETFMFLLSGYNDSIFQDFESYLRTAVELVENDIKLTLNY